MRKTTEGVPAKIDELLARGVEDVIVRDHLAAALRSGRKLTVKLGIDPTAPDLHLGHLVVLRKLRQFQDLGHLVVLIIGDFTARVGDPSGQSEKRIRLSPAEIRANFAAYLDQAGRVLDRSRSKLRVRYNSEWFEKGGVALFLNLAEHASVSRILDREDFQKRLAAGKEVTMLEAFYSLLQGYDSVAIDADVELGGTDQRLNLLMARQVQKRLAGKEEDILMVPLLEGTDGVRKMSKSFRNTINLNDPPAETFGKLMSIPDALIGKYTRLLTDAAEAEITAKEKEMRAGRLNPRDAKAELGRTIVTALHSPRAAAAAEAAFSRVFREHELPSRMPAIAVRQGTYRLPDLLVVTKLAKSRSEAQRLIRQGGVDLDGKAVRDPKATIAVTDGMVLKVGKRRFITLRIAKGH